MTERVAVRARNSPGYMVITARFEKRAWIFDIVTGLMALVLPIGGWESESLAKKMTPAGILLIF